MLGSNLLSIGETEAAFANFKDALALNAKDDIVLNFESYAYAFNGDLNSALAANDAYIALQPGDPNPLDTRGDIFYIFGRDDEAVAQYRKVLELRPDFSDYFEYLKLAVLYTDQKKPDMARTAVEKFKEKTSALNRVYLPGLDAQFRQSSGDMDGALADFREAVQSAAKAKQNATAGTWLGEFAVLSSLTGKAPAALVYAQQQKLDGNELNTIATLQTLAANRDAAQQTLQKLRAAQPWLAPRALEISQTLADTRRALQEGDGQGALARSAPIGKLQSVGPLFVKGWAHVLTKDYASAEPELRATIRLSRNLSNFGTITARFPTAEILAHFCSGKSMSRPASATKRLTSTRSFSPTSNIQAAKLPQMDEARAALKRLIQ